MKNKHSTKHIGNLGEAIAAQYLSNNGFTIVERNYNRKWGELDIIAQKGTLVHFVEVKSVSYETKEQLTYAVTHETWRLEENVHTFKMRQIAKTLESWIADHHYIGEWVIDVVAVRIVPRETFASVHLIENVISDA